MFFIYRQSNLNCFIATCVTINVMTKKSAAKAKQAEKKRNLHLLQCETLKDYVNSDQLFNDLVENEFPSFPTIKYVSFSDIGELRLLVGGQCVGYKSIHLRNICNLQFILNIVDPFFCDNY